MSSIERAISIAAQAHAGQVDKAGQPYILHPLRVMLRVSGDAEQLALEGFSPEVLEAVDALTKRPGETRIQAAHRAAAHPVARVVKLADNAENLDISRIANPTARDLARTEEYKVVRSILLAATS